LGAGDHRGSCSGLTGLAKVPELLNGPMKPLQPESLAVEEQNSVVFLVLLAASLECHFWFSQLIVVELHRNPIFLGLV
jgi:hypothetical protein